MGNFSLIEPKNKVPSVVKKEIEEVEVISPPPVDQSDIVEYV